LITAGQDKLVQGQKGTKVYLLSNTFLKRNGDVVTSGSVTIKLQEMLTGPDMILANRTTTSNGALLQSGGQILLKAYQDGEELFVNPDAKPQVLIPTNNPEPMNLYYGSLIPNDTTVGDTAINWNIDDNPVQVVQDSFIVPDYYAFVIDTFTYLNCDYFANSGLRTNVTVNVPPTYVDSNTVVFLYFPAINSVLRIYNFGSGANSFREMGDVLPIGYSAKVVVISQNGTQYYYDIVPITISANITVSTNPSSATLSDIKTALLAM
jgi:hypothetical protein